MSTRRDPTSSKSVSSPAPTSTPIRNTTSCFSSKVWLSTVSANNDDVDDDDDDDDDHDNNNNNNN